MQEEQTELVDKWVEAKEWLEGGSELYPSRFKHGDMVRLTFPTTPIEVAFISAIKFTESSVLYDILIPVKVDGNIVDGRYETEIKEVESSFVEAHPKTK